jgi:hypothetical protein
MRTPLYALTRAHSRVACRLVEVLLLASEGGKVRACVCCGCMYDPPPLLTQALLRSHKLLGELAQTLAREVQQLKSGADDDSKLIAGVWRVAALE